MNAIPLVMIAPIKSPEFDDTNLGSEGLWVLDNAALLAAYWLQLGRALGIDDCDGQEDIDLFLSDQHKKRLRERALPHGGSL